jgi:hypothetical protein
MIKGQTKTQLEAQYRAVKKDSSSSLKDFSQDRKKYYKKYIKGEKVEEKENHAANMGRIVETILLEKEEFDNRFYMSTANSAPTGLMLEFVEALYRFTKEATDEFGVVTRTFEDISKDAYVASGFKIRYEAVLGKFLGSEAEIYYNEIRTVRSKNLTVVTTQDVSNAEKIVEGLKSNTVTAGVINLVSSSRYTVLNQLQIEDYKIDGLELKSMLDKVIVDHEIKFITPIDLKCTWSVENFYEEYYLYRRAYIQAYLYYNAVVSLTTKEDSEYYGYTVENLQFLVCDSTNYMNPLIYTLSDQDMQDCYLGFTHKGKTYPGVKDIISDLKWALNTDTWNISRVNHLSGGIVNIKGL